MPSFPSLPPLPPPSTRFPYSTLFRSSRPPRRSPPRRQGRSCCAAHRPSHRRAGRSEAHTSDLQSPVHLVCRLFLHSHPSPRPLHAFPTRRSSDLPDRLADRRRFGRVVLVAPHIGLRIGGREDRKRTRLISSHPSISYAVFSFTPTPPPALYTLSLLDALPIFPTASQIAAASAGSFLLRRT